VDAATIVELTQASPSADQFQQAVLTALMRHVGADVGAFGIGPLGAPATHGFRAEIVGPWASAQARHATELAPVLVAARAGATVDTDVLGERGVRSARYFAEIVRPHGGRDTLCAAPAWGASTACCLWLGRCGPGGHFRRRDVAAVDALLPAIALASVAMAVKSLATPATAGLSVRERQIVDLLRRGFRSREIAAILGTSPNTVRNQIGRLMARLGAGTRAELIVRCATNDLR